MFEPKAPQEDSTEWTEPPQALMQGNDVVAVVFEPHYAELFSQAPQMLMLIQHVAAGECDFAVDGHHDDDCKVCAAQRILAAFTPVPVMH
jgi:hypothetical protein